MHKRKILTKLKNYFRKLFVFGETVKELDVFDSEEEILKRQRQISKIGNVKADFLKKIEFGRAWNVPYSIVIATRDDDEYMDLMKEKIPCFLVRSPGDLQDLIGYDVVLTNENIDLPQAVPYNIDYPIYSLKELSVYIPVIDTLIDNLDECSKVDSCIREKLFSLKKVQRYLEMPEPPTREMIEEKLEEANEKLSNSLRKYSGDEVLRVMYKKDQNNIFQKEIERVVEESGFLDIFTRTLPIQIDERELENYLKNESVNMFTDHAYGMQNDLDMRNIGTNLKYVKEFLTRLDFAQGISRYKELGAVDFPKISEDLKFENVINLLIKKPKPISFYLDDKNRCSFLTGANSGGKTTLLELIIQVNFLLRMGLPVRGSVNMPLFEIEYLAKTKGSISKGAFETLLGQFSKVGKNVFVLADEIEAVTEPGVAADIICATAKYCINNGCYCVFATHLGKDLVKRQPDFTRIDGIEAKGIDKKNKLIIDHNPVIGRIAASTPELIIQRLANDKNEYYKFLAENMAS